MIHCREPGGGGHLEYDHHSNILQDISIREMKKLIFCFNIRDMCKISYYECYKIFVGSLIYVLQGSDQYYVH